MCAVILGDCAGPPRAAVDLVDSSAAVAQKNTGGQSIVGCIIGDENRRGGVRLFEMSLAS
jgi:hypothetical protein